MKKNIWLPLILLAGGLWAGTLVTFRPMGPQPAGPFDFEKAWQQVDSLKAEGQPRAAATLVNKILDAALQAHNDIQLVKAHLYRLALWSEYQENYELMALKRTHELMSHTRGATRNILQSIMGRLLYAYYNQHQWELGNRQSTTQNPSEDIREWSPAHFSDSISACYQESLKPEEALYAISARDWTPILDTGAGSALFRPSLYDILAWEALEYFKNENFVPGRPVSAFQADHPDLMAPPDEFNRLNIRGMEGESQAKAAFLIFQKLSQLHSQHKAWEALVHATLERLDYARNLMTLPEKDSLLITTLRKMEESFHEQPASAWILLRLAEMAEQAGKPEEALKYCEKALSIHPHPFAEYQIKTRINEIKKPALSFTTEPAVYPSTPALISISWKNMDRVWFRIYPFTEKQGPYSENLTPERMTAFLMQHKALHNFEISLPNPKDYKSHSSDGMTPALEPGFYLIAASSGSTFDPSQEVVYLSTLRVSRMNGAAQNLPDGKMRILVADRKSGQAMAQVQAKLYARQYNYRQRSWDQQLVDQNLTDKNGEARFKPVKNGNWSDFSIELTTNNDTLIFRNIYPQPTYRPNASTSTQLELFTDRAIYRPGQTLYYKGILISRKGQEVKLKVRKPVKIKLMDANGREVATAEHLTNRWGSFSGSFAIPPSGLNGNYTLWSENGSVTISVEDYKRPVFEVKLETPDKQYRSGEKVEISGQAMAYAGYPVSGARVRYRVLREEYRPWGYWGWRIPTPAMEQQVAASETRTGADGRFTLEFKALGSQAEYYRFRTEVTVTDINGESRQAVHSLLTGPAALLIRINIPEKTDIQGTETYRLLTTNLEGKPVPAQGFFTLYKLRQPEGMRTERTPSVPDIPLLPKTTLQQTFPDLVFDHSQELDQWPTETTLGTWNFDTHEPMDFGLKDLKINTPGVYKISFRSTDAFGQPVENNQYVIVFDSRSKELPYRTDFWFMPLSDSAEPRQILRVLAGTLYKNIRALVQVSLPGQIIREEWIKMNQGQVAIELPIPEAGRGNMAFNILFFAENRIFYRHHLIQVPFTNKKLKIITESMRKGTEPGAEEKFSFRILTAEGKPSRAEALATLYDASLDAFRQAPWNFFPYSSNYGFPDWILHNQWVRWDLLSFRPEEPVMKNIPELGFDRISFMGYPIWTAPPYPIYRGGMMMKANRGALMQDERQVAENAVAMQSQEQPGQKTPEENQAPQPRDDFKETAFFLPHLMTDDEGRITFSARMPESLTRWKFRLLAFDTAVATGYLEATLETRKPLMVVPNPPRFLHTGDTLVFPVKVVNLTDQPMEVRVTLGLRDAITGKALQLTREDTLRTLQVAAGAAENLSWKLTAPDQARLLSYQIIASSTTHSDGVLDLLPVLSSRKPLIDTWPLYIPAGSEKTITTGIQNLRGSDLKVTLEVTGHPAWYALQALPWFDEPRYESAQAWFETWYAQQLGLHILRSNPRIRRTVEIWQKFQPQALQSALMKNQDLKNISWDETPFFSDGRDESLRKARLADWLNENLMESLRNRSLSKIKELQLPNGGFSWFRGMPDSRFITLEMMKGMGRLRSYGALSASDTEALRPLIYRALNYLDEREWEEYQEMLKKTKNHLYTSSDLSPLTIYWLYVRAMWSDVFPLDEKYQSMQKYYLDAGKEAWKAQTTSLQAMLAITYLKNDDPKTSGRILRSLMDKALNDPIKGMYWANRSQRMWYESDLYTQVLVIESFAMAQTGQQPIEAMKQWLIWKKRTELWENKTATLEALAALMLRGNNPLEDSAEPMVEIGGQKLNRESAIAGSGYFRTTLSGQDLKAGIDPIRIGNPGRSLCWAAIYAQYQKEMDEVQASEGGLSLRKKIFVERQTSQGLQLVPVQQTQLSAGDRLVVRLMVENEQPMEYVHLKDFHAAGTEPVDVISGFRWQEGMGFYQSTRDEATHFFIYQLPAGKHFFEYQVQLFHEGDYTSGFAEIQCQYAPEFSARSASLRLSTKHNSGESKN
ncbi:MAG: alpha-2-macroglobulin family protein [Bacteroidales bacterium]